MLAMSDDVQYGLDNKPRYTNRLSPAWWSETRRQELEAYFAEHLAKLTCPITMGIRAKACQEPAAWYVRKVEGGYRLEQPENDFHLTLEDKGPGDELSENLARWAEGETPLMVEVVHGP